MKELIAIGKNIYGKTVECTVKGRALLCGDRQLTELTIPMGVTHVSCCLNQLTELTIPEGVTHVYCHGNQLTELTIPTGVEWVSCHNNQITHLTLPESVFYLKADKEVAGLEKHVGRVRMKLR